MSTRTGVDIAEFAQYGAPTGSATVTQLNNALDDAWAWVENFIGTPIIQSIIPNEQHLFPVGARDYNAPNETIVLANHHLVSVSSVVVTHDESSCTCSTHDITGCSQVRLPLYGLVDIRDCDGYIAHASCACVTSWGSIPKVVTITYIAGLFANAAAIESQMKRAIYIMAKDFLREYLSPTPVGPNNVTSWRNMDYNETRGASASGSYAEDSARERLVGYRLKRAFGPGMF